MYKFTNMNVFYIILILIWFSPIPDYIACKFIYPLFSKKYRNGGCFMFVKKAGKYFLTLTDSQVSLIMGLIQERQKSILTDENMPQEVFQESLAELCDLQSKLFDYRSHYEKD